MGDVVSTMVTGVIALTGVWLGQYLQSRQSKFDKIQSYRSLLREKSEELIAISAVLRATIEKYTLKTLQSRDEVDGLGAFENIHRAETLIVLYFPDARPIFSKYQENLGKVFTVEKDVKKTKEDLAKGAGEQSIIFANEIRDYVVSYSSELIPQKPR